MCVRLRRRRAVNSGASLPRRSVLEAQDAALAPMRSRIFRRIGIGHLGPVLDLGAGPGVTTPELARRSRGPVVALDRDPIVKQAPADQRVVSDATELPFPNGHFALVYAQFLFLWNAPAARLQIAREVARVLAKDGVVVAVEPDWAGALEHPTEIAIADVVAAAIIRAGGHPDVGRRLPSELSAAGLHVRVEQASEIGPPSPARFLLHEGLPFTDAERLRLREAEEADRALDAADKLVYVPNLFISGGRRPGR
jgi:SAM-dependent methyltransferase